MDLMDLMDLMELVIKALLGSSILLLSLFNWLIFISLYWFISFT